MNNFQEIINQNELPFTPKRCSICAPEAQRFYWRSNTNKALTSGSQNGSVSIASLGHDGGVVPKELVDVSGRFWASAYPIHALAVGISRGIVEQEEIQVAGFTYCGCHANILKAWEVFQASQSGSMNLIPINNFLDFRDRPDSAGTIFEGDLQSLLEGAVWFPIPQDFSHELRHKLTLINSKLVSQAANISPLIWKGLRNFVQETEFSNTLHPKLHDVFASGVLGSSSGHLIASILAATKDLLTHQVKSSNWQRY